MEMKEKKTSVLLHLLQGALIGFGAVLPGVSGGVLCVVFGVYKIIMELMSHPIKALKKNMRTLVPVIVGVVIGFLGLAKLLGVLLERYPDPSVCLFIGLIVGMLPSMYREAGLKGRTKSSWAALGIAFVLVFTMLVTLKWVINVNIATGFGAYMFCGACLALSIICPGMSFSTTLMPLGLYQPFVDAIGNLDFSALIPAGIGALLMVVLFAKAVSWMLDNHYSVMFHAIIGIVIAATIVIIPFASFASAGSCIINVICLAVGVAAAFALDKFNQSVEKPEE